MATEYGETVLKPDPLVTVHKGRMEQEEIREFLQKGNFAAVVDATHPYAQRITSSIKEAMKGMDIPRLRLKREEDGYKSQAVCFGSNEICAKALEQTAGNILLTTGSRDLEIYCRSRQVRDRLYVRVLPAPESISKCIEQGICGRQIIAMQGPFSAEMNEAMIRQYNISCLVTKASGSAGGYEEKLEAAKRTGAKAYVIGRPQGSEEGMGFAEVCRALEKICGRVFVRPDDTCLEIILAGAGMGDKNCLTAEVQQAVHRADVLLGSKRLLEQWGGKDRCHPFYEAAQVIPILRNMKGKTAVILFSGDSGFYSGCASLYTALKREIGEKRLKASVRIMPGISSVAFLAACVGESYGDGAIYSMHGKDLCNLAQKIKGSEKTFLLTSGVRDVNRIGRILEEAEMDDCRVITGYQLSNKNQKIRSLTPQQCCGLKEEGLYTCLVKNPSVRERKATHGIEDEAFIRDKVPMTKEEVRDVSICKLKLHQKAVVYDIGSGTGSVAVEIAGLRDDIQVFAIERKKEAVSLIRKNRERFRLENIIIEETEAPEGLFGLPAASHAFIGGSGGRLKEILDALQHINSRMRVVINAVSIETLCELREILQQYKIKDEELLQIQVSKARKAAGYHLMQAENPVWICAFRFAGERDTSSWDIEG